VPADERAAREQYLSVNAAAEVTGYGPDTIYRAVASGDLPARRPRGGRTIRIARSDLDDWLRPIPAAGQ
jgi:excisionase family DNA binding protein